MITKGSENINRNSDIAFHKKQPYKLIKDCKKTRIQCAKLIRGGVHTLRKDKYIAKEVEFVLRSTNLSRAHAQELAPLPEEEKKYWAEEIKKEAIPVRELKQKIKERKKALMPKPIIPEGIYNVLYVDPPWDIGSIPAIFI